MANWRHSGATLRIVDLEVDVEITLEVVIAVIVCISQERLAFSSADEVIITKDFVLKRKRRS